MQKSLSFIFIIMLFLFLCFSVKAQEEQGRSYYDLGVFAYEDRDYDAALENFKKALSFSPDEPYYNHYTGKTLMNMERYDEAEKYLERALGKDPGIEELKYDYAFLHYKVSNYEKSAHLFSEIVKKAPSNLLAQYHCGISLYETKQYSEALNYFLNASAKSPSIKTNGYYYAGICYRKMGKEKQAIEMFEFVKNNADSKPLREYAIKWLNAIEQEKKILKSYNLYTKIGYRHDDNVRLEPLDQGDFYADEGDKLALGLFSGKYNLVNKRAYQIGAGFTYYQTKHDKLYEYDLMAGIGDVYIRYRLDTISLGLDYIPSQYWVDSEKYLLQHQFKPQIIWNVGEMFTTKLSVNYFINDHLQDDERDGDTSDLFLDNYYSIFHKKGIIFGGIGYEDNDASNDDYYYTQMKTKLGFSLTFFGDITIVLTGKYNDKKYDNVDSSHLVKRTDSKYIGSASLSSKLIWSWLNILLEYSYTDNQSNIDIYTYIKSATTLSLVASF